LGIDAFDTQRRTGLVHMGFPRKMLCHPDGHVTSTDILHTVASAIIFDVYGTQDVRLVSLDIPAEIISRFPGPAYGPAGLRRLTEFPAESPGFGTILKPTAGLTPSDVERLVGSAAACPLFMFIKEDENFYPELDYAPVAERTSRAVAAVNRAREIRGGAGVVFAPHITAAPHELRGILEEVVEAGAAGVMLSETFAGGAVRMVREATRHLRRPPAIYGHNAGIGVKTRAIWREIIDFLARLDGIDLRQTAPVSNGVPFLRPYGREWSASEHALSRPVSGIEPTAIVRAGGLDQGNIILNLVQAEAAGQADGVLYLAGSAINSLKGADGRPDPRVGAQAMLEAVDIYRSGELRGVPADGHLAALVDVAERNRLTALREALRQRYPREAA
jgi:ribulose-bisphosphate carboxylase large chain